MSARKYSFAAGAAVIAMLAACGDDVTNVNENASLEMAEKYEEMPTCEEAIYGSVIYAADSAQVYACTPGGWSTLKGEKGDDGKDGKDGKSGENGKNGESCTATALKDGSGIEVKCGGEVATIKNGTDGINGMNGKSCTATAVEGGIQVSCPGSDSVVIKNGEKGETGANGLNGANGESCTATPLQDGSGYNLVCGEMTVGTIKNGIDGVDGKNGTNGSNGESCTAAAVEGGVQVSCPGSEPVIIKNGEKGADGRKGTNGTSCTANPLQDGTGYNIVCGGVIKGTVKNGENGAAGTAGESCTATSVVGGVQIACPGSNPVTITNGADGASAYELSGTELTLEEWLASLKGAKGDAGTAGESCTATSVEEGIQITCPGSNPVTIMNGQDGATGATGATGAEGASCTATELDDKTGYKIVCGEDSVGVVLHGKDATSNVMIDSRDKNIYRTVKIGDQIWMAENLNYATETGSYCYDDNADNCATYGRLYTWATAVGKTEEACGYGKTCNLGTEVIRGVCPEGWHLPSLDEWKALIVAVDGSIAEYANQNVAGKALKSASGWNNNGNGTDAFGFSALPAGYREIDGSYIRVGYYASIWSSSEYGGDNAYLMYMNSAFDIAYLNYNSKNYGLSVRCLKD